MKDNLPGTKTCVEEFEQVNTKPLKVLATSHMDKCILILIEDYIIYFHEKEYAHPIA